MDRRQLLALTTGAAVCAAGNLRAQTARVADPLKINTPAALQGISQAVAGMFGVAFVTERTDVARAGGGLMGSGFGGRSSARSKLEGLSEEDFQAATDAAYDAFIAQITARPLSLSPREPLLAEIAKANIEPIENGAERGFVYGRNERGKVRLFGASQQGAAYLLPTWLGMITHRGFSEARSSGLVATACTNHARATGQHVLSGLLVVDFANADTYGGFFRSTSAVSVKSSLAAWDNISQISAHAPNGRVGSAALKSPIALGGDYGSFENTTTNTERAVQLATNIVGALGGIGTNSTKKFTMTADAPKWRQGVDQLSREAFTTLTGGLR